MRDLYTAAGAPRTTENIESIVHVPAGTCYPSAIVSNWVKSWSLHIPFTKLIPEVQQVGANLRWSGSTRFVNLDLGANCVFVFGIRVLDAEECWTQRVNSLFVLLGPVIPGAASQRASLSNSWLEK